MQVIGQDGLDAKLLQVWKQLLSLGTIPKMDYPWPLAIPASHHRVTIVSQYSCLGNRIVELRS